MQIDHIALWANDLEKVKDFYLKYFNCISSNKYQNLKKRFSSYFIEFSNGARIELMKQAEINAKRSSDMFGYAHIAIQAGTKEKVNSLTKKMKKDGVVIESNPRTTGDGYYESVVLDPENNKIEITSFEDYTIKEATASDLKKILYLQKYCYLSEAEIYNDYSILPLTQDLESIKKDLAKQTILKLEFKKKIIGSVRAYVEDSTCHIGRLIVDSAYQNMGFAVQLMHEIEKKFKDAKRFVLFTGFKSEKNLYLYNKLGYAEFRSEKVEGMTMKYLEKCR